MTERRKHERLNAIYKVDYYVGDEPEKYSAYSFNISLGGLGLNLEKFVQGGNNINLFIYMPDHKEPIHAKGEVVWQKHFNDIGQNRAGVEFTDITWNNAKTLINSTPHTETL